MKCPKCKKAIKLVSKDLSLNTQAKPQKKYQRSVYHCEQDDIWLKLEIPSENK